MLISSVAHRARKSAYPLMERPALALALAGISGALNAWTLANAGAFATVQSGNIVSVGYYTAQGDWSRLLQVLASVAAFGLGAALSGAFIAVILRHHRSYSVWVLGAEALLVAASAALASTGLVSVMFVTLTVSFVAGLQGNAFHRDSGMLYGNTAVTFVVQMTFSMLGRASVSRRITDGDPHLRLAGRFAVVLLAFAGGAAVGFLLDTVWSAASLLAVAFALCALTIVTAVARGPVDPAQNAPTP